MRKTAGLLSLLFLLSTSATHAQVLGAQPLTILLSPQYPAPYQTVTVTPQSTLIDLARATVTISVDGKVVAQSTGGGSASFTAGGAGSSNTITVSANSPEGSYQTTATVHPTNVALIEEPVSTTHPFYEGAAQVAIQGEVRFVAMADLRTSANGAPLDPAKLVYSWHVDSQALESNSGIGKSSVSVVAPMQYRDETVSVTVSTQDGSITGSASATLAPTDPTILFYRDGPLIGPNFDTAIGDFYSLVGDEDSFRAVGYSFSTFPTINWSVNGTPSVSQPTITLRPTGTGAGSATVSATASFPGSYVSASREMTVQFGQSTSHSIFGL
ncbi:MAG TPA: hypothetical protein VHC20_00420 [Candidatus Paceibacterota bacterium]|nr:hypothetical protein [Candidatus Paceibacterota bacterium]